VTRHDPAGGNPVRILFHRSAKSVDLTLLILINGGSTSFQDEKSKIHKQIAVLAFSNIIEIHLWGEDKSRKGFRFEEYLLLRKDRTAYLFNFLSVPNKVKVEGEI
jgi:hypothetical protein